MSNYIMDLRAIVGHRPLLQVGASVIVVDSENRILLQLRSDNHCWGYAGGSVELDEVVEDAAARELYEETGAVEAEITPVGIYKLYDYGLLCFAEVRKLSPIPENSEIAEITFCERVPQNLTYDGVHDRLHQWVLDWIVSQSTNGLVT